MERERERERERGGGERGKETGGGIFFFFLSFEASGFARGLKLNEIEQYKSNESKGRCPRETFFVSRFSPAFPHARRRHPSLRYNFSRHLLSIIHISYTLMLLLFASTKFCDFGVPMILRVLIFAILRSRAKFCDFAQPRYKLNFKTHLLSKCGRA